MARPSANTDARLIQAARELLPKTGCSGLNVRQVAQKADVNLGMFHYHFKSKENFVQRVLQEIYEELFSTLSLESTADGSPLEELRETLLALSYFARDNRTLIIALLRDTLNDEQEVIRFVKKNFTRHFTIIISHLKAAKSAGMIKDYPLPFLVTYMIGSIALPILLFELFVKSSARKPFGIPLALVQKLVLSDDAIAARLDLLLSALSTSESTGGKARE